MRFVTVEENNTIRFKNDLEHPVIDGSLVRVLYDD